MFNAVMEISMSVIVISIAVLVCCFVINDIVREYM